MTETTAATWLTQEAYDRLKAELEEMSGPRRTEIAARIAAAREEQGKLEARIRELTEKLRNVQIGTPADDGVVEPGMVVTAVVAGDEMRFLLGSREIAGDADIDVYSPTSPLGAAIIGHVAGDKVTYAAPTGREIAVEIVEAKPFAG